MCVFSLALQGSISEASIVINDGCVRIVAGRGKFFKFFAGNKKAPLCKGGRMPFVRPLWVGDSPHCGEMSRSDRGVWPRKRSREAGGGREPKSLVRTKGNVSPSVRASRSHRSPSGTSCHLPRAGGVCLAEGGVKGCAYSPIEAGWSVGVCSFWYFREAAMKPLNSG